MTSFNTDTVDIIIVGKSLMSYYYGRWKTNSESNEENNLIYRVFRDYSLGYL